MPSYQTSGASPYPDPAQAWATHFDVDTLKDITTQNEFTLENTPEATFWNTLQAFPENTFEATHENTLQATYKDTLQATYENTLQATHENTLQATHENTLQATHENTLQATHENTPEATHEHSFEAIYKKLFEATYGHPISTTSNEFTFEDTLGGIHGDTSSSSFSSSIPTTTTTATPEIEFTIANYEYFQGISGGQAPPPPPINVPDADLPTEDQTYQVTSAHIGSLKPQKYSAAKPNVCPDVLRICRFRDFLVLIERAIPTTKAHANDRHKIKDDYVLCGKLVCRKETPTDNEPEMVYPLVTRERYHPVLKWAHIQNGEHKGRDETYSKLQSRFSAKDGLTKSFLASWIAVCPVCKKKQEALKEKEKKEKKQADRKARRARK